MSTSKVEVPAKACSIFLYYTFLTLRAGSGHASAFPRRLSWVGAARPGRGFDRHRPHGAGVVVGAAAARRRARRRPAPSGVRAVVIFTLRKNSVP